MGLNREPLSATTSTNLTDSERQIMDEIARRRDELVALASDLIAFDTTAREHNDDPAREEAALQKYLAARLRAAGAETDVWEPAPEDVAGSPMTPRGLRFEGRPQLTARFAGAEGGQSLLFNGHIDVVTVEPREQWTSDPFRPEVRDGNLYGRGSCDMKGGIASMVFAAEVLASLGMRLAGDLIICTVTDEESTGCGALAAVAHGVRADAGIVPESTDFEVKIACRGSLMPTITVPGRSGHAGCPQPHWREGGAVNAIDKASLISDAMRRLETDWRQRGIDHHPYLSPGDIVPTMIAGGEWMVSYPASCRLDYHIAYLPGQAAPDGWGGRVRNEVEEWVMRASQADPWLMENPPTIEWAPEVPAAAVAPDEPIVSITMAASTAAGRPGRVWGTDGWFDGATFTLSGTPTIGFGPGNGSVLAHVVDEYIPVDDLITAAQALAIAAVRFCGPASDAHSDAVPVDRVTSPLSGSSKGAHSSLAGSS
ncbi:MAG: ArgE/DapE family deacylase [Chloroflexi bacterium]|nr:ArgE/DapE family deacylase [Chloroflexota bacterium]